MFRLHDCEGTDLEWSTVKLEFLTSQLITINALPFISYFFYIKVAYKKIKIMSLIKKVKSAENLKFCELNCDMQPHYILDVSWSVRCWWPIN